MAKNRQFQYGDRVRIRGINDRSTDEELNGMTGTLRRRLPYKFGDIGVHLDTLPKAIPHDSVNVLWREIEHIKEEQS